MSTGLELAFGANDNKKIQQQPTLVVKHSSSIKTAAAAAKITTTRGSDYFDDLVDTQQVSNITNINKFTPNRYEHDEFAPVRKLSSSIRSKSESTTPASSHRLGDSNSSLGETVNATASLMRRKTARISPKSSLASNLFKPIKL